MIDKTNYYINTGDFKFILKNIGCYPGVLTVDNSEIIHRYIELFTITNKLFKKFNIVKDIHDLKYDGREFDFRFKNNNEFHNFIQENLEKIKGQTKKEKMVTIGEFNTVSQIDRWLRRSKTNYSENEKNSINILYDIVKFMGLNLILDKKYISELKLSDTEIKKIDKFIVNIKKTADEIANTW